MMKKYIPKEVEAKWQKKWEDAKVNKVSLEDSGDKQSLRSSPPEADAGLKKFYLLVEFTYPSGDLHMGHWFAFAVPDILSRYKKMQGFEVFAPNGFDAFGLPAENAAIRRGIHPRDWTLENIGRMKEQFNTMGAIYDWEHEVITCDPEYYRWNQWIFLKMLEKGLAYRGKALANWCPADQCVLANENVENGRCWRCGTEVVQKEVDQWFLKITDYAEKLLWPETRGPIKNRGPVGSSSQPTSSANSDSQRDRDSSVSLRALAGTPSAAATPNKSPRPSPEESVDWPQSIKGGQNNWIGKTDGVIIKFKVKGSEAVIDVFTTRPDTIYGATFLVLAPEHPMAISLTTPENKKQVEEYIAKAAKKSELERKESREKTGTFTGSYVTNPISGSKIPVWIADYALVNYGTGALFGDAHDERDVEFAKKYDIALRPTIVTGDKERDKRIMNLEEVFTGYGTLVDSGEFSGLSSADAKKKITAHLVRQKACSVYTNYHLHDWSISRQRYWGTPIPVIYCGRCPEIPNNKFQITNIDGKPHAIVPVPETDLPVELPYGVDYAPKGKPPLATAEDWVKVKCPKCGKDGRRETETMDTFVDSSWYFLRYLDPQNKKEIAGKKVLAAWMPVDIYFGGAEHTLGHTLYSRFFVKFLQDIGVVPPMAEYAQKRLHHGVILGPDGSRMSKSHGNVVNPDDEIREYGADAVRMYLAFLGPYDLVAPWVPSGLRGVYHFLERVWALQFQISNVKFQMSNEDKEIMHRTIKKVGQDIEAIKFNTAVAALMEWLNYLSRKGTKSTTSIKSNEGVSREEYETLLKLLAPFAPHMTEEIWQIISGKWKVESGKSKISTFNSQLSIHSQPWPEYDEKLARASTVTIVVQVNGKVRDRLPVEAGIAQKDAEQLALNSPRVTKFLGKGKPQRVIFVPDKLINFVA